MNRKKIAPWTLHFDGRKYKKGSTVGIYPISPNGERTLSSFTSNLPFQTMKYNMKNFFMGWTLQSKWELNSWKILRDSELVVH